MDAAVVVLNVRMTSYEIGPTINPEIEPGPEIQAEQRLFCTNRSWGLKLKDLRYANC